MGNSSLEANVSCRLCKRLFTSDLKCGDDLHRIGSEFICTRCLLELIRMQQKLREALTILFPDLPVMRR